MIKLIEANPKANRVFSLRPTLIPTKDNKTSAQDVDVIFTYGSERCPASNAECHFCHKTGHLSNLCYKHQQQQQQASVNELNNQTIPKSLQESRHRDKNMDVVDLLSMYNHYDKDHSDLARSLNCLEMDNYRWSSTRTLCYTNQFQKVL